MSISPMDDDLLKLDNQLCFALYAATRAMMNTYRGLLGELNLTFPQYLVMLVLWEDGHSTVKDLGNTLYLDSGTLSPLLKRLESAGLITRTRSSQDERAVIIRLTETGIALKNRASPIASEFACRTTLATDEFAQLRSQLRNLAQSLNTEENKEETSRLCQTSASMNSSSQASSQKSLD